MKVLGVLLLLSALPARSATLTVNNGGDGVNPGDGLTLREAILLARGDLRTCVGTVETRQVSTDVYWLPAGPPCVGAWNVDLIRSNLGGSASDRIVFDSSRVTSVTPTTQLPWIFDNDSVDGNLGNGLRLLLEGVSSGGAFGLPIQWVGINQSYAGGTFSNLRIARFRDGIHASGVTRIKISNVEVQNSIGTGIKITFLTLPDGSARNSSGVVIGGPAASDRVFSHSNADDGIILEGSSGGSTTGHLVGPVSVGFKPGNSTQALGNGRHGLVLQHASGSVIGRDGDASMANFFVGNGVDGISLVNNSDANDLFNNVIGTDPGGTLRLGNGSSGIAVLSGSSKNRIGAGWSNAANAGNVVAANRFGIFMADPGTDDNTLTGNFVGTDRDFHGGLANGDAAVTLYNGLRRNRVGIGPFLANGNWLMGSTIGVDVRDASTTENTIRGNSIGAVDATRAMPNFTGVMLRSGAHGNTVMENMIARNQSHAVWVADEGSSDNVISSNLIGTNTVGSALGNGGDGVRLDPGARTNQVLDNTIRFNQGHGVGVAGNTSGNEVRLGVTCNAQLALDLSLDGPGCSGGDSGGNMCSQPPKVTGANNTLVKGTSAPFALIDVYETAGLTCVTRWLGSTFADQTGSWILLDVSACTGQPGQELRATQTPRIVPFRGTSELSSSPFTCP